jgi:hypothetical protein
VWNPRFPGPFDLDDGEVEPLILLREETSPSSKCRPPPTNRWNLATSGPVTWMERDDAILIHLL